MSSLFGKFRATAETHAAIVARTGIDPFGVRIDRILSPSEAIVAGRRCLHLGSNNYLGLTFDPDAVERAAEALRTHGTGTTGSRAANGTYELHQHLERQVAGFYGRRHAMVFTTGYQANVGFLAAVGGRDDVILIDADSHASIFDGCKLGDATVLRYRHNDPEDLDRRLRRLPRDQCRLVVTEGIFSMLGDRAPLAEIVEVAGRHGAEVMVDEAHSMGVLGARGRGLAEEAGVEDGVDFILGTFSKSAGAIGGFCVSDHDLAPLRLAARAYLFTASLPPSVIASVSAAMDRIAADPSLTERLRRNAEALHAGLAELGFTLGAAPGPVIAVRMPDVETGLAAWHALLELGVYVNLAAFAAVPGGGCLLRCSVSAAHRPEDIETARQAFASMKRRLDTRESVATSAKANADDQLSPPRRTAFQKSMSPPIT